MGTAFLSSILKLVGSNHLVSLIPSLILFKTQIISQIDSSTIRALYFLNIGAGTHCLNALQIIDSNPVSERVFKSFFIKKPTNRKTLQKEKI